MKFEILNKEELIDTRELGEGTFKIGRAPDNDIVLKSSRISKHHAMIVIKGDRAAVIDAGSSNGVFVNGILVKKQRIDMGDEVGIAEFRIRIARPSRKPASPPPRSAGAGGGGFNGNAAINLDLDGPAVSALAAVSPREKLLSFVDSKVLIPYYELMKHVDSRMILGVILISALVISVLLSVIPFIRWGKNITTQESLARAHTILSQTVRENYRIVSKSNDFSRLTVEAAEAEKGMLSVYIVDPRAATVLSPAKHFNKTITEVFALLAIRRVMETKEEQISVEKDGSEYIVAQPIYTFNQDNNERVLSAIVLANFAVAQGVSSTFEPTVEAALFSVLLSLLAFFFISKLMTYPVGHMHDQLDAALKGENVTVTAEARMPELEVLAQVINFAVTRVRQAGGGMSQPVQGQDSDSENALYESGVAEFDIGTSDALLLLDKDNKVRFVGKALEEMIGMRNQYAVGQNISDACRDQSFAGTSLDLADRVRQSMGAAQAAQLDINGISRGITAVGHKNPTGDLSHVLITVKLGGG